MIKISYFEVSLFLPCKVHGYVELSSLSFHPCQASVDIAQTICPSVRQSVCKNRSENFDTRGFTVNYKCTSIVKFQQTERKNIAPMRFSECVSWSPDILRDTTERGDGVESALKHILNVDLF